MKKTILGCLSQLALLFLLISTVSAEISINGIWKHATKDVDILIDLDAGVATVSSHKDNPDAEGLTVIKSIERVCKRAPQWRGLMFNGYKDIYEGVSLELDAQNKLSVTNENGEEVLALVR